LYPIVYFNVFLAVGRRLWQQHEQEAVKKYMLQFIVRGQLPKKDDIEPWLATEPALASRSWKNIKDFVRNSIISNSRSHAN
jgi:hypothetical protein